MRKKINKKSQIFIKNVIIDNGTIQIYVMEIKMRIIKDKENILIKDFPDFSLRQTLECGQCFHFEKIDEGEYGIVHGENLLHAKETEDEIVCYNISEEEFMGKWYEYFDFGKDYGIIKKALIVADERLKEVIEKNNGIRILNQHFDETLMSFIISQNKQIPHIKKIVRDISREYGKYLGSINGIEFYSYPEKEVIKNISEEDYKRLKTGFRAAYLRNASEMICREDGLNGELLRKMSYEDAKNELIKIKGVGEKVANCVLLFSLGFREAFPVDVWMKRIMEEMYFGKDTKPKEIMEFAKTKFGEYGGYAQQYLFFYAIEKK